MGLHVVDTLDSHSGPFFYYTHVLQCCLHLRTILAGNFTIQLISIHHKTLVLIKLILLHP